MKQALLQASLHLRFVMAMLAMLGAMWATIDLHPHEDGLHQLGQCAVCSLEESVSHGFTVHTAIKFIVQENDFIAVLWQAKSTIASRLHIVSIRAPPFA
ncbi:MAG: hypothetical protein Q9M20_06965 [Mariprofundaceae bacterium]|nr:hypothetical protein [Mariprofundaceae bacterium]